MKRQEAKFVSLLKRGVPSTVSASVAVSSVGKVGGIVSPLNQLCITTIIYIILWIKWDPLDRHTDRRCFLQIYIE